LRGTRTLRTKGTRTTRLKFAALSSFLLGQFTLSLVIGWRPRTPRGGALMVLRSALGAWFLAPAAVGAGTLAYIQALPASLEAGLALQPQPHWWRQLAAVRPYAQVSSVASVIGQSAQFARAVGSTCRVLLPDAQSNWALVTLPSGQLRFLPNSCFAMMGGAHAQSARFFATPNAGWARRAGRRPTVRGIAKNPNDHPHGGRAGTIRYPRTPWGKTAKCPRPPRQLPPLKALVKRKRQSTAAVLPY